eukprot:9500553-Pyramimonas_sp.AAC.1
MRRKRTGTRTRGRTSVEAYTHSQGTLGTAGKSDWKGDPLDPERGRLAGQWLCSPEKPFRAFIYAILGDLEYYASHLQMPYPNDQRFCWLCPCHKGDGENAFNNFIEDRGSPCHFCQRRPNGVAWWKNRTPFGIPPLPPPRRGDGEPLEIS